ncbi:hypothetical protein BJY01DRAFT_141651 [Aspergillus pseudoustus]|uniref:Secreted protein n=1 Tax=Aspergillus pseudoustus TaxID=1810923 RepID=A0ABR4KB72_9EURO
MSSPCYPGSRLLLVFVFFLFPATSSTSAMPHKPRGPELFASCIVYLISLLRDSALGAFTKSNRSHHAFIGGTVLA